MNIHPARPTSRSTRRAAAVALAALAVLAAGACSDEQKRLLGEEDAKDSLDQVVAAAVEGAGLQLEGDLDCAADLDAAGGLTASCSGIDSTGAAVSASYDGVADPEAETCRVRLVVTLGDRPAQSTDGIDCFDVG